MKTHVAQCAGWAISSILAPVAMAATFTVTNTNDSGAGSFRNAIIQANNDATAPVRIHFNMPAGAGGVAVIQPLSPLPIIQNIHGLGIIIDGFTQPGSSVTPGNPSSLVVTVELDGSQIAPPGTVPPYAHGLHIMSSGNTVQGLCVHSFPHDGICIQGIPKQPSGPSQANANQIQWNLVGTNVKGTAAMPNGHGGGGLWGGIYVKVLPGMPGIANQNQILENVVSGNTIEGVGISNCPDPGSDVQQNHVERCYIGLGISGSSPLGNGHDGVYIGEGAHDNVVEQNWIAANGYSGVGITGYGPSQLSTYGNLLFQNRIGVDVNLNPMGNLRHGVAIGSYGGTVWGYAPDNTVDTNIIAWNGLTGVAVEEDTTVAGDNDTSFNTITTNAIYQNGQVDPGYLGIDLAFEPGVTPNDAVTGDPDNGPNGLMNFPVITSAVHNAGTTTVNGTIDPPGYPVTIEVFRAMPGNDGSNHGQGAAYLGATTASGPSWSLALTGSALPGQWLTATATDASGNTSEFSLNEPVWDNNQQGVDYGDAPDSPYPTLIASGGPGHQIQPGMYLGNSVDGEANGQPNAAATGDDNDGNDDGDGVSFPLPLVPGQQAQIDVVASMQGRLDAWIDFDGNGAWSPAAEQILASAYHPGGGMLMSYTFSVPPVAVPGNAFARIRYSSGGGLLPFGPVAPDGEVEDHQVNIKEGQVYDLDWGDAPDPSYPTLFASNGAYHVIVPGIHLGKGVDAEPDGQPHPYAAGDDRTAPPGSDDEDGVIFLSPIVPGGTANVQVTASVAGDFYGWVDFDGNGSWADPGEMVFNAVNLAAGVNSLSFPVPTSAAPGTTYARFRFTSVAGLALGFTGPAPDGDVEDYILEIEDGSIDHKMHWAQLPDPNGWDVRGYEPKILADDFRCTESGPITRITFWGSWREDEVGEILNVHLSIHDDDRSGDFSKPGQLLWEADTAAGLVQFVPDPDPEFGDQGWIDPNTGEWFRPDHQQYFKYTVNIPVEEAFVQEEGTIYWLDIQVTCEGGEWGWKTSRAAHFEDDAVWDDTPQDPVNWHELVDPVEQLSLDLAFVIGQTEEALEIDWGDLPDPSYATLKASNGPRHIIVPGYFMGTTIDAEPDGQPSANADGDDNNLFYPGGPDDEDGVYFYPLVAGQQGVIDVTVTGNGFIDAWIDFNGNGSWFDAFEQIATAIAVTPGLNQITFTVPGSAVVGQAYARARFSSTGGLAPTGAAPDGEVEDYQLNILPMGESVYDFGDAVSLPYPTLVSSNGARHVVVPGYHMGPMIDAEPDGQPSANADGDDNNLLYPGGPDDEDGVYFYPLVIGQQSAIDVSVTGNGFIDAWIDFNANGSWLDAGEQIAASVAVTPGLNQIVFSLPANTVAGPTYARVRFSQAGGLAPTGAAPDGEVEDYRVNILPVGDLVHDFGDAPDPAYPTLAASNGARHQLGGPLWLGAAVDPETDGQPTATADGDDLNGAVPDDEDGVTFCYALINGQTSLIQITASAAGFIDMWIDWNANGSWADIGDIVLTAYPVTPGLNNVVISVPSLGFTGSRMARVRLSGTGYLPPTGFAPDGEVEDYEVMYYQTGGMDFGDAPNQFTTPTANYETTMLDLGAAHFIDSLFLGWLVDAEADGWTSALADGDDLASLADEDGVILNWPWISGVAAKLNVVVNAAAPGPVYDLDLWVDWNGDGTWAQANEHVLTAQPVVPGPNPLSIQVPGGLGPVWTFARFRLTHPGTGSSYTGYVYGGEVEDYMIPIGMRVQAGISIDKSTTPPQAVLAWPAVTGATSYSIYSSTNLGTGFPNPPNWTLETTTASLTWSDPMTVAKKFYIVVAFP